MCIASRAWSGVRSGPSVRMRASTGRTPGGASPAWSASTTPTASRRPYSTSTASPTARSASARGHGPGVQHAAGHARRHRRRRRRAGAPAASGGAMALRRGDGGRDGAACSAAMMASISSAVWSAWPVWLMTTWSYSVLLEQLQRGVVPAPLERLVHLRGPTHQPPPQLVERGRHHEDQQRLRDEPVHRACAPGHRS